MKNVPRRADEESSCVRVFVGTPLITEPRARAFIDTVLSADGKAVDLEVLRVPEDSVERALDVLSQVGMFSTGRCVWIRNLGAEPAEQTDKLLAYLTEEMAAGCVMVATASRLDQRSRLWKWLDRHGAIEDLRLRKDRQGRLLKENVAALANERAAAAGVRLGRDAVERITECAGGDVAQLVQEIDKVCLACSPGGIVDARLVDANMRDQRGVWLYSLTDAVGRRRLVDAEAIVERLMNQGEHPLKIIAAVANQVATLIEIHPLAVALPGSALRNAGAFARDYFPKFPEAVRAGFRSPFQAYHSFVAAARFDRRELRAMHRRLVWIDGKLKSSRLEPRHMFSEFLAAACAARP